MYRVGIALGGPSTGTVTAATGLGIKLLPFESV